MSKRIAFSILMPARRRPEDAVRALASLRDHAANADALQYLVRCDTDDRATADHIKREFPKARVIAGKRYGYRGLHRYYNQLARRATGEWLVTWNDDAFMQEDYWDVLVSTAATPVCVIGQTGSVAFPIVSRGAYEAVGRVFARGCCVDSLWEHAAHRAGCLVRVALGIDHQYQRNDEIKQDNGTFDMDESKVAYSDDWATEWAALLKPKPS